MQGRAERRIRQLPATAPGAAPIVALGEVLWDLFDDDRRLGGAPLNFAAHLRRLGHTVTLVSALGTDELGRLAEHRIRELGLDCRLVQNSSEYGTGTARVRLGAGGEPGFVIERPAAYDALSLGETHLAELAASRPDWLYYGSLFAAAAPGRRTLDRLLDAVPNAAKFCDLNLRPGSAEAALVLALLEQADVVKLNQAEVDFLRASTGLPAALEVFCRQAAERFDWLGVAVTRGTAGAAVLVADEYAEAPAEQITVVDTVGAGDAFSAAFLHGICQRWPAGRIAAFANSKAAAVAAQAGAVPAEP